MNREGLKKLNGTTVTINTLLMPLIDVGGYESVIGPQNLEDNFIEGLDLDTDYYSVSEFDMGQYIRDVTACLNDYYMGYEYDFKDIGVEFVKSEGYHSPREYNFTTDSLNLIFKLSDDFDDKFHRMVYNMFIDEKCKAYMDAHFKSCSGFISLMPESFEEMVSDEYDDVERLVAAYIALSFIYYGYSDEAMQEEFETSFQENYGPYNELLSVFYDKETKEHFEKDDYELSEIMWKIFYKVGWAWRGYGFSTDAARFCSWACDQHYSWSDLKEIAAS